MAVILRYFVVAVVIVLMYTRPSAIPLAMTTMVKLGFFNFPKDKDMGLRLLYLQPVKNWAQKNTKIKTMVPFWQKLVHNNYYVLLIQL